MVDKISSPNLKSVLQALLDNSQLFPEKLLPFFSDISCGDLDQVKKIWPEITLERKISLLADLEEMMGADTKLSCDETAKFALTDEFPEVRAAAIALLGECDDPKLVVTFCDLLENDENDLVQIAAAEALGKYVLLGELEEIPAKAYEMSLKALTNKLTAHPSKELHQELVKSLAYSSQPEITPLIENAFKNPDPSWQLTAVIAMGRSADNRWEKPILQIIESGSPDLLMEAITAAGELELTSAREPLFQFLEDEEDDAELRALIILALAKIGGDTVKSVLQRLMEETEDDEEAEIIAMALDELDSSSDLPDLDIS